MFQANLWCKMNWAIFPPIAREIADGTISSSPPPLSLPPRPKGLFCGGIENNRGREILFLFLAAATPESNEFRFPFFSRTVQRTIPPFFFSPRPSRLPDFFPPFLFRFVFFFLFAPLGGNVETKGHFSKLPRMRERRGKRRGRNREPTSELDNFGGKKLFMYCCSCGREPFPREIFFFVFFRA